MQSGTAIGLLVGGAVLLLAASPRPATAAGAGNAYQYGGGAINPLNWFSQPGYGGVVQPSNGGLLSSLFAPHASPALSPGGGYYQMGGAAGGGYVQPSNYANSAQTPNLGWGSAITPSEVTANNAAMTTNTTPWGGAIGASQTPGMAAQADAFPVMTPMGGFQSAAYMAGGSPSYNVAANTTPYEAYG